MDDWMILAVDAGLAEVGLRRKGRDANLRSRIRLQCPASPYVVAMWSMRRSTLSILLTEDAYLVAGCSDGLCIKVPLDDPRCFEKVARVMGIPPIKDQADPATAPVVSSMGE
jgi:hypothetical protein